MTAQEALEEARRAEAAKKEAAAEATAKRELAQKLAEEARARFLEEKAKKEEEEGRRKAELARKEAARRAEEARKEAARREHERQEADAQAARDRALADPTRRNAEPRTGPIQDRLAEGRVRAVLTRLADDIEILETFSDIRPEVLAVLWQAHLKRSRQEHDLSTVALALALATRFSQHPEAMLAARVRWGEEEWAVWIDTERREILAALRPADRYLTGL